MLMINALSTVIFMFFMFSLNIPKNIVQIDSIFKLNKDMYAFLYHFVPCFVFERENVGKI